MTPSDHMSEKYIILTEKYQRHLTHNISVPLLVSPVPVQMKS